MAARNPLVVVGGVIEELPSGDTINGASGSNPWTLIKKTTDTTRTSNATLTADPDFTFTMTANKWYAMRAKIFFDTSATADFKWRHVLNNTPSNYRLRRGWIVPGGTAFAGIQIDTAASAADNALTSTGTTGGFIEIEAIIMANSAANTIWTFQWAQNTSDVGNTIVRAGSYIEYMQVN